MFKNNEKLNKFIENFMFELDPSYSFRLSDGFIPHHIVRAISGKFTDIRMENDDLEDLVTIGFVMAYSAYETLNGQDANENDFKEWFEEYLELRK